ncbi:similar to Saccharomyces cerevisiae YBR108W AIM3 Protein interacting with Rvs167p [Maudiozyma barnettii]|nr:similar to Saccharomyces cerevisiae YBR108W AIM3 Protein interacting with Rvs167p [Kazachstania barnettii]
MGFDADSFKKGVVSVGKKGFSGTKKVSKAAYSAGKGSYNKHKGKDHSEKDDRKGEEFEREHDFDSRHSSSAYSSERNTGDYGTHTIQSQSQFKPTTSAYGQTPYQPGVTPTSSVANTYQPGVTPTPVQTTPYQPGVTPTPVQTTPYQPGVTPTPVQTTPYKPGVSPYQPSVPPGGTPNPVATTTQPPQSFQITPVDIASLPAPPIHHNRSEMVVPKVVDDSIPEEKEIIDENGNTERAEPITDGTNVIEPPKRNTTVPDKLSNGQGINQELHSNFKKKVPSNDHLCVRSEQNELTHDPSPIKSPIRSHGSRVSLHDRSTHSIKHNNNNEPKELTDGRRYDSTDAPKHKEQGFDEIPRSRRRDDYDEPRSRRGDDYDEPRSRRRDDYDEPRSRRGDDYDEPRSRRRDDYDEPRSRRRDDYDDTRSRRIEYQDDIPISRRRNENDYEDRHIHNSSKSRSHEPIDFPSGTRNDESNRERFIENEEDAPPLPSRNRATSEAMIPPPPLVARSRTTSEAPKPLPSPRKIQSVTSMNKSSFESIPSRPHSISQTRGPPPVVPKSRRNTIRSDDNNVAANQITNVKLDNQETLEDKNVKNHILPNAKLVNELANMNLKNNESKSDPVKLSTKKTSPPQVPKKKESLKGKSPMIPKKKVGLMSGSNSISNELINRGSHNDINESEINDNEENMSPLERYKRNLVKNNA